MSQALSAREAELESALASGADCPHACEHLGALCELAERICALALAEPDPETEARCSDGKDRCTRARTRTEARCTCAP